MVVKWEMIISYFPCVKNVAVYFHHLLFSSCLRLWVWTCLGTVGVAYSLTLSVTRCLSLSLSLPPLSITERLANRVSVNSYMKKRADSFSSLCVQLHKETFAFNTEVPEKWSRDSFHLHSHKNLDADFWKSTFIKDIRCAACAAAMPLKGY